MKNLIAFVLILPVAVFALTREEWQPSPENRGDAHRTEQEWQRFNFAQTHTVVTNCTVTTNAASLAVLNAVTKLATLAQGITPILAVTGLNYDAIKTYGVAHADELTDAQAVTLYKMDAIWQTVKDSPHLADGLANFRPSIVTTNCATVVVPK